MAKLTAKAVRSLNEPGRYSDGEGLYLYVAPGGSKSWVLRTAVQGKRKDIGLGGVSWVGLAEAREKARQARKIARDGGDPLAERRKERGRLTFEEAARRVHEMNRPGWREGGVHVNHWIRSLELYAFPLIGEKPVDTIQSGDVLAVLTPIWHRTPETARRVRQRLRQVMQWAIGANLYTAGPNPVDAAEGVLPRHQSAGDRHFPAMPYEDVPGFMAALSGRGGVSARALEFVILTASRSGEVRGAHWSEVDAAGQSWTVPAERMKHKRPHRVPLSPPALAVLETVRGWSGDLLFPGQKPGKAMSDMTLASVLKRMDLGHYTVHGFRSSFRDWAGEQSGAPREIAELCLSHLVGNAVERAYARSDLFDRRRALLEEWAVFCCSGEAGQVKATE